MSPKILYWETYMIPLLAADAPILNAFGKLPDPRKSRNQTYPLIDIPKKVQKSADLNFFTTEITEHTEKKLSPKSTNSFL